MGSTNNEIGDGAALVQAGGNQVAAEETGLKDQVGQALVMAGIGAEFFALDRMNTISDLRETRASQGMGVFFRAAAGLPDAEILRAIESTAPKVEAIDRKITSLSTQARRGHIAAASAILVGLGVLSWPEK